MAKAKVVVSRKWTDVQIRAFVTDDAVGAEMMLDDFVKALAAEVGNPALLMTRAQLLEKLQKASVVAQWELKDATKFVV